MKNIKDHIYCNRPIDGRDHTYVSSSSSREQMKELSSLRRIHVWPELPPGLFSFFRQTVRPQDFVLSVTWSQLPLIWI
jgi:hypothetical protein